MYKSLSNDDPQLSTLFEASKDITTIDLQPDSSSNHLAIGYNDGSLDLYQPDDDSWSKKAVIKAHEGRLFSVKFDTKHGFLATSGSDGSIALWSVDSGSELRRFPGVCQMEFTDSTKL